MMRSRLATALAGLLAVVAVDVAPAAAQCRIDLLEAGIEAYRALDLTSAVDLLDEAVETNGSSRCGPANARALAYLGAAHWLGERPDSAMRAFERAVVQAPRFRPDPLEFPPTVTDLFDRVRRETPAVATMLPDLAEIGPSSSETLRTRLTASVDHPITVTVRSGDTTVRTLYDDQLQADAAGTTVAWDGRDDRGDLVDSGWYDLEVVSKDAYGSPIRMVVVSLSVESDAPVSVPGEPDWVEVVDTIGFASPPSSVWKAVAVGAAGLAAGGAIVAVPLALDGGGASWVRYPVAGAVGLAGIIGFFQQLGNRGPGEAMTETRRVPVEPQQPNEPPTLLIRPAQERRIELGESSTRNPGSGPSSAGSGP